MTTLTTLRQLEGYLRRNGFELHVVIAKRQVTVMLRRKPPARSFVGRGLTLLQALNLALERAGSEA